jgi:CoA-substrate-specific enzyme activase, putative
MLFAGVDIGSTTSKCVLIDENKEEKMYRHIMTGFNRDASGNEVLEMALKAVGANESEIACIVSTGYGRKAFKKAQKDIPEIIAHAEGTKAIVPDVRTIIDIGGQDSKVIAIAEDGTVSKFEMNDKCAAGTGRFFEVLTHRLLGVEMDELSDLIMKAKDPIEISSMCTIFAESEIISHLSQGKPVEDIAAGTGYSIARRIIQQGKAGRIPFDEPIIFSGGVANNEGITKIFEKLLGKKVTAISNPQSTAAYGAALRAMREYNKQDK